MLSVAMPRKSSFSRLPIDRITRLARGAELLLTILGFLIS